MKYEKFKYDNYNIHLIKTNKFKTIEIQIKYQTEINSFNVTKRALLPYVLKAATQNFPSKLLINRQLEEMYGARLNAYTNKIGKSSIITFSLRIVNDKYLNTKNLLVESFAFIKEIIFNPYLENNQFSKSILDEEKRLLKEELSLIKENKAQYALKLLFEKMFRDETYRLSSLGIYDDIDQIDSTNLYSYYKDVIANDQIDIIIAGDLKNLNHELIVWPGTFINKYEIIDYETFTHNNPLLYEVKDNFQQSQLVMGFRTKTYINDLNHYPMVVFNTILGGYSQSKLFLNVREKASLAYSISSSYDGFKGVIFISAGINSNLREKAFSIIQKQIDDIKNHQLSEEELSSAKKTIINDLYESMDSLNMIINKVYLDHLINRKFKIESLVKKINDVTIEDVIRVSKMVLLDSTLYLIGEGNEED